MRFLFNYNTRHPAITDVQDPVITNCPSDVILTTPSGITDVSVTWPEPTATDDSGSVALTASHAPGDVFPIGLTTVVYTFSDTSGNSATCSFNVTISSVGMNTPLCALFVNILYLSNVFHQCVICIKLKVFHAANSISLVLIVTIDLRCALILT